MGYSGSEQGQAFAELYSEAQTEAVLQEIGVDIDYDNESHFICYCPFHGNTDSPAFEVDKEKGLFHCFNPACGRSGKLEELVMAMTGFNAFKSARLIYRKKGHLDVVRTVEKALSKPLEFPEFSQEVLDRMYAEFWEYDKPQQYMASRKFEEVTLRHFQIGYSAKRDMVVVPMHDPNGNPVGIIGRTPDPKNKTFKNSKGLPKSKTAFNFHRAKREGDTVVIVEASFDAMRVHQAGYPNVVALLGGHLSSHHIAQLGRTFSHIVVGTDNDKAGTELGNSIANGLSYRRISWSTFSDKQRFPEGAKDFGDCTDDQIRQCIKGAVSNFEYQSWLQ